jgi:hypothetical protein
MTYRLTYNRKTILQLLAEHAYLTTDQFYELLLSHMKFKGTFDSYKRNIRAILRNFTRAGYVRRDQLAPRRNPEDGDISRIYRASQPYCYRLTGKANGVLGRKAANVERSPASLSHEVEIATYHIALGRLFPAGSLYWKQSDLRRTMNPDALFAIKKEGRGHWFFLEVEKSRQGNQRGSKSGLERKCERYGSYRGTDRCREDYEHFRDFRLIIVFASRERQMNFIRKVATALPYRWLWTTNENDYRRDAGGKIYLTPKDFVTSSYSILET